ncbi:hypothetical protein B0H16DRAFT_1728635 [Mycena metata]|uniref:BTB domain-containing protein n=1 Tax=Mycena metata TaxID=1033252 RepID=A0AAD7N189_9AGAR|nr:hypothetical protein B0H16DRAFT_1728635 [Mycena metata]
MAKALVLDSPPKWTNFRLATLKRVLRLVRTHLGPTLVSHRLAGKTEKLLNPKPSEPSQEADDGLDDRDDIYIFEVEQTLFKVHHSLFRLKIRSSVDSTTASSFVRDSPNTVVLPDTAENFRFFLWDLQAFPYELRQLKSSDLNMTHVVDRLLNITEMAIKHDLSVLESHALESLRNFVLSPCFCHASSKEYSRILRIATTTTLTPNTLLRDLSCRLVQQILRRREPGDPTLLSLAENDPRLQKIQGALYYCELIATEQHFLDRARTQPVFPKTMDVERRMRFLAAHISLSALSEHLCAFAPALLPRGCPSHSTCQDTWAGVWTTAVAVSNTTWISSADVLGRLRVMMPLLKRMVSESPSISIDCSLAALEVTGALRDEVVDTLLDHFSFA